MSKEPNRHQLSSRLSYNANTPAFLRRLQKQVAGQQDSDDEQEFEDDGSGRPPIPRRPAIPQRPDDDPGSADEDDLDEKPQIVVLREGKHLSERDVENEKRKAKGLPPLPEPSDDPKASSTNNETPSTKPKTKPQSQSLSFASSSSKPSGKKRKILGDAKDDEGDGKKPTKAAKKKPKKAEKKLLSFDDDA